MSSSAKYTLSRVSSTTYRLIVTVVARVGLVENVGIVRVVEALDVVEVVKVGVLVGVCAGIICMGVAVARTGVGVLKVGVNRSNCSTFSLLELRRSSGGGGPFRRLNGFIMCEQPREDSMMAVCLDSAQGWRIDRA